MKLKKIKLEIKWIKVPLIPELEWHIHKEDGRNSEHIHGALYYPIRRMVMKLKILNLRIKFKLMGIKPLECQGCGEGIATVKIIDPNDKRKRLLCCKNCAHFYNRYGKFWIIYYSKKGGKPIYKLF